MQSLYILQQFTFLYLCLFYSYPRHSPIFFNSRMQQIQQSQQSQNVTLPLNVEHCYYINLDRRTDRMRTVEAGLRELSELGMFTRTEPEHLEHLKPSQTQQTLYPIPQRFPALPMACGAVGCSMSHLSVLKKAYRASAPYVFICEDDALFLQPQRTIESLRSFLSAHPGKSWDVCLLGGNNQGKWYSESSHNCGDISSDYVQVTRCFTTVCYLVNGHYIPTLMRNVQEGVSKLVRDVTEKHHYAIDVYWGLLQREDRWFLLIPLAVSQAAGHSDVEGREVDYSEYMLEL